MNELLSLKSLPKKSQKPWLVVLGLSFFSPPLPFHPAGPRMLASLALAFARAPPRAVDGEDAAMAYEQLERELPWVQGFRTTGLCVADDRPLTLLVQLARGATSRHALCARPWRTHTFHCHEPDGPRPACL